MEKQITIWEWIEELQEQSRNELSRIISLDNTFSTEEIVIFNSEQMFIINEFTIWATRMDIDVHHSDILGDRVSFTLYNGESVILSKTISPNEYIRIEKYTSRAVELTWGVL